MKINGFPRMKPWTEANRSHSKPWRFEGRNEVGFIHAN